MDRESNIRKIKHLPDLFDEALELEETYVEPSYEEPEPDEVPVQKPVASEDPTFFDEQVINVPLIDPPDMKETSSYPDAKIYEHLLSSDDDFLLDDDTIEEILSPAAQAEPVTKKYIPDDEIVPVFPDLETELKAEAKPERTLSRSSDRSKPQGSLDLRSGAKKKPPVKRAGMPKEEIAKEPPVEEVKAEEEAAPIRKKPRVRRAGEAQAAVTAAGVAAAAAATAAVDTDAAAGTIQEAAAALEYGQADEELPPIALMEVGSANKPKPKRTAPPQKRPGGRTQPPAKKPAGARGGGKAGVKPSSAKPHRAKPAEPLKPAEPAEPAAQEEKTLELIPEKTPEKKQEKKKRPFSPLEKMRQKLAQKWS